MGKKSRNFSSIRVIGAIRGQPSANHVVHAAAQRASEPIVTENTGGAIVRYILQILDGSGFS
jgi:hypothetical protein